MIEQGSKISSKNIDKRLAHVKTLYIVLIKA